MDKRMSTLIQTTEDGATTSIYEHDGDECYSVANFNVLRVGERYIVKVKVRPDVKVIQEPDYYPSEIQREAVNE